MQQTAFNVYALTLLCLPDTVLRILYDMLSRDPGHAGRQSQSALELARTCSRMNVFYREEYVTALSMDSNSSPEDLARALLRVPRAHSFNLNNCIHIGRDVRAALLASGPGRARRITSITMESAGLDDAAVRVIAESCPDLEHLVIGQNSIGDAAMLAVLSCCPKLTTLSLRMDSTITDLTGRRLAELPLKHLTLESCDLLTDATFESLASLTTLEHLAIHGAAVSDASLVAILCNAQPLTSFSMIACDLLTSNFLRALPSSLEVLSLERSTVLSDEVAMDVFTSLPRLTELWMGASPLFTAWSNFTPLTHLLQKLYIADVPGLVGSGEAVLRTMHCLEAFMADDCDCICDESIRGVSMLPELKKIEVTQCQNVTARGVFELAFGDVRHSLRVVDFSGCSGIVDSDEHLEWVLSYRISGLEQLMLPTG
jgi:hypothetical protein